MGKRGPQARPLADRFWARVEKRGPDECWPWTGYRDAKGYGQIALNRRTAEGAHRVSWALARGEIPDGIHVLHRCDNPPCCNPAHLFLGTHADNMWDMKAKGRASGGPGPLTVNLPNVQSYFDRHGKPRYYLRRKGQRRIPLPAPHENIG